MKSFALTRLCKNFQKKSLKRLGSVLAYPVVCNVLHLVKRGLVIMETTAHDLPTHTKKHPFTDRCRFNKNWLRFKGCCTHTPTWNYTHTAKMFTCNVQHCQIVTLSFASLVRLLLMANYPRLSLQAKSNIWPVSIKCWRVLNLCWDKPGCIEQGYAKWNTQKCPAQMA